MVKLAFRKKTRTIKKTTQVSVDNHLSIENETKLIAAIKKRFTSGWMRITRDGNGPVRFYTSDMTAGKMPKEKDWTEQTDPFEFGEVEVNTTGNGYTFRIPPTKP